MNVNDLFSLKGKVAIVTGGSIGLGAQMSFGLAEAGANVVVAARKVERCVGQIADRSRRSEALCRYRCGGAEGRPAGRGVHAQAGRKRSGSLGRHPEEGWCGIVTIGEPNVA